MATVPGRGSGKKGERPKTLIERMGFKDQDRRSATHDEIQLWVLNNPDEVAIQMSNQKHWLPWSPSEIKTIRSTLYHNAIARADRVLCDEERSWRRDYKPQPDLEYKPFEPNAHYRPRSVATEESLRLVKEWEEETSLAWSQHYDNEMAKVLSLTSDSFDVAEKEMPDVSVDLEVPIRDGKWTVGFMDVVLEFEYERLGKVSCGIQENHRVGFRSGRKRCEVTHYSEKWSSVRFGIEIKTAIPSIGELLRELKYYRGYTNYTRMGVVAPDDRFADVINSQGFVFIPWGR